MNILFLMMGGSGTRFGASRPKQYTLIDDVPVFAYILRGYNKMEEIDKIVVVSHKDWLDYVEEWKENFHIDKLTHIVKGGDTRSESVLNGLSAVKDIAAHDDVVLLCDATHPYVDVEGTKGVIEGVKKYGGATLGQRQYDTVYRMNAETCMLEQVVPRQEIVSGASPEAFRFGDIYKIYSEASKEELEAMTSAGAIALAHNIPMVVVPASVINLKITYPGDMDVFKKLVHTYFFEE